MTDHSSPNRQRALSRDPQELEMRIRDAKGLVHDIIGRHQEFFAEPQNRLDFMKSQTPEDFLRLARHVNAKLRGEKPHQLRHDENEKGGFLPMLHTPSHEDKPAAFASGYEALRSYLETSSDSIEKKIEGAAMATEALIVWVHPFNDGNGRTSRFLAKMIEDGAVNVDELVEQTGVKGTRRRLYTDKLSSKENALSKANNEDIMFEDEEREELRQQAESLPSDVVAIGLSIKELLENDEVRQRTLRYVDSAKDRSLGAAA